MGWPRERNERTWICLDSLNDSLRKSNEIQEHPKRTNMTAIVCLTFIIRIIPQGLTQHKYVKRSKKRVNPKESHFQAALRACIPVRKLGLVSRRLRWRTELSWAGEETARPFEGGSDTGLSCSLPLSLATASWMKGASRVCAWRQK